MREGQAIEAQGDASGALTRYDQALALLRSVPADTERVRREIALVSMNRGNVLQKQGRAEALPDSIRAYDEAIAFMQTLPLAENSEYRNSLGAAFMNRGHAQQSAGDRGGFEAALVSHSEAITLFRTLPLNAHRSFSINLSAALMNKANVLVALNQCDAAVMSASESRTIAGELESTDPVAADVALKARRVQCEALGRLLYTKSSRGESIKSLADEAIDIVEEGLALSRSWESRGFPYFRSLAARLYRFGAQLYSVHQPHFLAEFLLEHVDPDISTGAMSQDVEFYQTAQDALADVRQRLSSRRTVILDTPETSRLVELVQSLRTAEARFAELRAVHLPELAGS
jgi:tetratricopeptide (TPR) repeat protein